MEVVNRQGVLVLDPRTKLICILSAGCLLTGTIPLWAKISFLILGSVLLFSSSMVREWFRFLIVFMVMVLLEMFLLHFHTNPFTMFFLLICQLMRRFFPCLMMALVFVRTTTISELMAAVQKMHLPYGAAIPFAVVIRFFPTFQEEYENIRQAMKMRGIHISLEHILVPMLHSAINICDELSAAALSRGLGAEKKRTNMCHVSMNMIDWCLSIGVSVMAAVVYIVR